MSPFWRGFASFPICLLIAIFSTLIATREYRAWYQWFKGLPIFQYPAMLMLIIAAKVLNVHHCKWMNYEDRVWLSPRVRGFDLRKDTKNGS